VRVPVLSLNKYYTLPNYSGIELFLDTVPGIYSSFDILYEKYVLQKSKFTLREIGIILASNRTYLKKYNGQYTEIYLNMFIIKANINMITKRTFDK
jgi:hypothetical protein